MDLSRFSLLTFDCYGTLVDWERGILAALRRLATRYRMAILSNVDDDLFAGTARLLDAPFDWVVTAEQVGSYKPSPGHFLEIQRRSALPAARNRRGDRPGTGAGSGATPAAAAVPDLEVPDLASLAALAGV